jgi:hypothetical protein
MTDAVKVGLPDPFRTGTSAGWNVIDASLQERDLRSMPTS